MAFGATETYKLLLPDGRLGHAEIRLGDSLITLSDESPENGGKVPEALGGSPVSIHRYVDDVDAFVKKALAAGAKERNPVMDQFYGDRSGQLEGALRTSLVGGHAQGRHRAGRAAEAGAGLVHGEGVRLCPHPPARGCGGATSWGI
jgi:hypothetical protein